MAPAPGGRGLGVRQAERFLACRCGVFQDGEASQTRMPACRRAVRRAGLGPEPASKGGKGLPALRALHVLEDPVQHALVDAQPVLRLHEQEGALADEGAGVERQGVDRIGAQHGAEMRRCKGQQVG